MKTKDKTKYYNEILEVLKEINETYPSHSMGRHISLALGDYGDTWGLTDKEVLFAFTKYKAQLEMDVPRETNEEYIRKIEEDAKNLSIFNMNEEDN